MIECPKCRTPVGELAGDGVLEAVCPQCRFKYRFVAGRVTRWSTKRVTLRRETSKQPATYERHYELRLERLGGGLELVRFKTPGPDEQLDIPRGDEAVAVSTMRGAQLEEVVAVVDVTTGERFDLEEPGGRAASRAEEVAGGTGLVLFVLAWWLGGLGFWGALLVGVGATAAIKLAGRTIMAPRVALNEPQRAELAEHQRLLQRKRALEDKLAGLDAESKRRAGLVQRLTALGEKMASVGRDVYGTRMDAVDRALGLLARQEALDKRLRGEYQRAVTILEIEHEAARTTDALGSDGQGDVLQQTLAKLDELHAVEAENAAVGDQLAANDEVSRLLG